MSITPTDPTSPELDLFDPLPDSLLLLILNYISDVKSLGRCSLLSKRFHSLTPLVQHVLVPVDCVISHDDDPSPNTPTNKSCSPISSLLRSLLKPLTHLLSPAGGGGGTTVITHHSPTQVLKNFTHLKSLQIQLPTGELGIDDDGVLLKWKATFGSTLHNCVILGASSLTHLSNPTPHIDHNTDTDTDNGSIPESFYTNGSLKLRVVWTISSLIAASARHYLLQPIIREHTTLDRLVLDDADGQGVLCMDREQLEELRGKPLSASSAAKRTLVPALSMRLWYAPELELPGGVLLKGATLVAIRPSGEDSGVGKEVADLSWAGDAFDGVYGVAARLLVKRRTYCLEMNSF